MFFACGNKYTKKILRILESTEIIIPLKITNNDLTPKIIHLLKQSDSGDFRLQKSCFKRNNSGINECMKI